MQSNACLTICQCNVQRKALRTLLVFCRITCGGLNHIVGCVLPKGRSMRKLTSPDGHVSLVSSSSARGLREARLRDAHRDNANCDNAHRYNSVEDDHALFRSSCDLRMLVRLMRFVQRLMLVRLMLVCSKPVHSRLTGGSLP
jgi:hypothetical protein